MENNFDKFVITEDYLTVRKQVQHFHPSEIASFYGLKPHQWTSELPRDKNYIRLGAQYNYNLPLAIMDYYDKNIIKYERWRTTKLLRKMTFWEKVKFLFKKELPLDLWERN